MLRGGLEWGNFPHGPVTEEIVFGSNFRPRWFADCSFRAPFEVMMVLGRGSAWSQLAAQDSFRNKISRKFHKQISHDFSGGRL